MESRVQLAVDLAIVLILIAGIAQFGARRSARRGNFAAALAMLIALGAALLRHPVFDPAIVLAAVAVGAAVAHPVAMRVRMIQIPSMVAVQNGAGGLAACIVSLVEMGRSGSSLSAVSSAGGILGLVLGAAAFSGSMIAAGKLSALIRQTPVVLPAHGALLWAAVSATAALGSWAGASAAPAILLLLAVVGFALLLGGVFSLRIGGADMPVLISFLNAGTGLAAAFCGMVIQNRFLIACGAMVGASGCILTHAMCKAMNRSVWGALFENRVPSAAVRAARPDREKAEGPVPGADGRPPLDRALEALAEARNVVIVPGYGMAVAQAQFALVKLANRLEALGKTVTFAVHPVAGRMPGHMNVLLVEAEAAADKLQQMDEAQSSFGEADLALIVGACDVVNPAAIDVEGTPISGMPILPAHEAKSVVVCNLDDKPGYSGVENPLYDLPKATLLWGDAKASVCRLLDALDG